MIFEILATFFGLIQGTFSLLNKRIHWIFYLLQLIALVIFSWNEKLYGDVVISLIFMVFCVLGFFFWNLQEHKHISACSIKERLVYVFIVFCGTGIGYFLLKATDDPLPFLDSFTTILSIVALFYMVYHKIDTWFLWFVADAVYVIQYALLPNPALYLLGLYILWTVMAVFSYLYWYNVMKKGIEKLSHKS